MSPGIETVNAGGLYADRAGAGKNMVRLLSTSTRKNSVLPLARPRDNVSLACASTYNHILWPSGTRDLLRRLRMSETGALPLAHAALLACAALQFEVRLSRLRCD
jgi:hypothetical protein